MRRLAIRVVPIVIALLFVVFQFFSSEKITNEAGRKTHVAMSSQQEAALGIQSFQQVLSESRVIQSGQQVDFVTPVARRLAKATGEAGSKFDWAVAVVESDQVNAFCLPGGKIVVYTGIIPVAKTEAGLATVMGHEMAHATLRHGSERLFKQQATQTVLSGVSVSMGDMDYQQRRAIMGALGAGAQYGLLMPFGRDHESEADAVGLTYMARAGYDPREALAFWERMSQMSGGNQPPEYLSTHPAHETRIARLKALMPKAMEIYQAQLKR